MDRNKHDKPWSFTIIRTTCYKSTNEELLAFIHRALPEDNPTPMLSQQIYNLVSSLPQYAQSDCLKLGIDYIKSKLSLA